MRLRGIRVWIGVFVVHLGVAGAARAQSNAEVNAGIQFDFSLPGARSLGMGGAFVALADDATSAWANPAGLTILSRPEVSVEGRTWNYNNFVTDRGHGFGSPTNIGFDNVSGLVNSERDDWTASISFLSFVYPQERWSLALFRHQASNFKANIQSSGPFLDSGTDIDRVDPFTGAMSLHIADYGGSVAFKVNDQLSIGAGVSLYQFSIDSRTARYLYQPIAPPAVGQRGQFTGGGQRFGAPNFGAGNILFDIQETGDDTKAGLNAGFLYRAPTWSVGGSVRQGPVFEYSSRSVVGPAGAQFPGTFTVGQLLDTEDVEFNMPDTYSFGVALRPTDVWLFSVEYNRVQYSQLSDNIAEVFGIEENDVNRGRVIADAIRAGLNFPDANQLRFGAEYALVGANQTVFLRLGAWIDPDHRMRFEAPNADFRRLEVLFRPGEDELHVAPGIGVTFKRFQIDGAFDVSKRINTLSVSSVYRF